MKDHYHKIYDRLYKDYVYEQDYRIKKRPVHLDEHKIIKIIKKSIEITDINEKLRPDAKYFLIVNFHHLIVRPLIEEESYRFIEKERIINLEKSINSDIKTIIKSTLISGANTKVSGHQIMRTIDRLWRKLNTTKLELWG